MFLGAIGAAHGLDLTAQGLQRGMDSWVCFVMVIRGCFILSKLWQWIRHGIVIVSHDVTNGSGEVARRPWRARRTRLTWWALGFKTKRQQRSSRVKTMPKRQQSLPPIKTPKTSGPVTLKHREQFTYKEFTFQRTRVRDEVYIHSASCPL